MSILVLTIVTGVCDCSLGKISSVPAGGAGGAVGPRWRSEGWSLRGAPSPLVPLPWALPNGFDRCEDRQRTLFARAALPVLPVHRPDACVLPLGSQALPEEPRLQ